MCVTFRIRNRMRARMVLVGVSWWWGREGEAVRDPVLPLVAAAAGVDHWWIIPAQPTSRLHLLPTRWWSVSVLCYSRVFVDFLCSYIFKQKKKQLRGFAFSMVRIQETSRLCGNSLDFLWIMNGSWWTLDLVLVCSFLFRKIDIFFYGLILSRRDVEFTSVVQIFGTSYFMIKQLLDICLQ